MKINSSNPHTVKGVNGTKEDGKAFESTFKDSSSNDVQTKDLTSYKSAVESAEAKVTAAEPKVTSAEQNLASAQAIRDNTSPTIEKQFQIGVDENNNPIYETRQEPNPDYKAAQDAVAAAEGELSTAKEEKTQAEAEQTKAQEEYEKAEKENEETQEAIEKAQQEAEEEQKPDVESDENNENQTEEYSSLEFFNDFRLKFEKGFNFLFGNKDNKTNSAYDIPQYVTTDGVYDLRNLETDKNKVAINLSSTPINNTQKTSLQNSSKNKNVKADKNQTESDNSTKQASNNKTAETLSKLQEDINLSDAVKNGTQLINDIKNAQTKEQVHDIILAKCGNDSDNAEKIYNYIMTNSPTNNDESAFNPYKDASNIYLMNLLYSNNGDKLVLSDNLLNVFKETTTGKDIDGNETEIPKKEYYVNYAGEICSIDYKYHEAKEDKAEYITMKFNEGDATSEINYYETQNDNGETFFHIMDSDGKDKTIETFDEFLKRLVITKNYTQDIKNSDLTTEEINERYTVLKEQDNNITNSMSALIKEFQSQGWFDERYNDLKELTGLGLTPEELGKELDGMSNYNKIMMDAENGNIDKAKNLAEKEFDRRLQNAKNWQEVYEELKTYYQDEKIALDIMNNTLCSDMGSVGLDNNGKIVASATDQFGQSASCEGKDIKFEGDLSLEKIKQSCNNEVKNYKLDTKEAIYKFLYRGGELSQENIDSFHKAEDKFTDYNTTIAYAEALRECKTPEDAFRIITGKDIEKDKDNITDNDIELFNKYYASNDNSEPLKFVEHKENSDRKGNGGSDTTHYYKLEIQYNKETNDFDIKYQEYSYDTRKQRYEAMGEPSDSIPNFEDSKNNENLFQAYNSNEITDKFQQDKFYEFYNNNSEYINNCIENYANWAINDEKAQEHFKKVMGREPQNADEIIQYLKEEGLYSESANYMQYDYTTKKQAIMGESKLDKLTSDYCTDMATYTSKVAHGLTMGFLLASVFLPVSGPAAKAISIATRASGYVDNVADFINMATNKQNYLDDNYANLLTSTAFEVFTKQGYRFFSGIASSESDKFMHSLIQNTGLEDSPFANNTLLAVLAKGSFEALVETGIALPFTAAVKTIQGGEYDFWEEMKENFFYDFLPYASGWRTMLSDAKAEMYTDSDNDGKYYYSLNEPSKRIYVDENDKPIKIVSATDDENKTVLTDYEYSKDGDNESVKVKHYNEDGSEKSCTVIEDNGKKVTWLNENGEPLITKSVENTENGSVTKYYRNGSDTPELTETRDKEGRLITAEGTDTKETFDKSGRCIEMVQKTESGENTVFSFDSTYGKQQGKIIIQNPGDGTCSMAALMIAAELKGTDSELFKMCNEQVYDESTCTYLAEKLGLEDADFSTNREPFQVLYEAYVNEHPNSSGNFATEVLGVYFDSGNKVLMEFDGNKEKIQEYASNKDTALTFSTSEKITVTDVNGESVELSNGHAYAVVGYDNDGLKLVDPEDPDKVIAIPESEMEKLKNAQVVGSTWKKGDEGYIQEGVKENFVRGTNAIQTDIDGIKDILSMSNSKFKKLKHALSSAEIGYTRTENQYEITKIGDNLYSIVDTTANKDTLSSFEMLEFLEKRASNTAMQEKLRVLYNSGLIDDLALKTIYDAQLKKESIFEDPTAGKKYAEALKMYKTRTYKLYNRIARGEKITDELIEECKSIGMTVGEIKSKIKYLSDYISTSELEEGLQLYRSDTYDVFSEVTIENGVFKGENLSELLRKAENGDIDISEIENALKNQTIKQKAFLSTSLTEDGAMEYQTRADREIEWIFTTKQHTQGMYIDIFMDKFTAEWEVLVDINSKININKMEYKNNRWYIYADLSS